MPTPIGRSSFSPGQGELFLLHVCRPIFFGKDNGGATAECFLGAPAKNAFRPGAPKTDPTVTFEHEHGVVSRPIDQQPKTFFAFAECPMRDQQFLLRAFALTDIENSRNRRARFSLRITNRSSADHAPK